MTPTQAIKILSDKVKELTGIICYYNRLLDSLTDTKVYALFFVGFAVDRKISSHTIKLICKYKISEDLTEDIAYMDAFSIVEKLIQLGNFAGVGISQFGKSSAGYDKENNYIIDCNLEISF